MESSPDFLPESDGDTEVELLPNLKLAGVTEPRRREKPVLKPPKTADAENIPLPPSPPPLSSPSEIYSNLLILEESLRQQYLNQRQSQRKYSTFYFVLLSLTAYLVYSQIYPSIYSYVFFFHRFCLIAVLSTLGLFHLSGMYTKKLVYPRKFIYNSNRGLRGFNVKLVKTGGYFSSTVHLVLNTRVFSTENIEQWEEYRLGYFERERKKKIKEKKERKERKEPVRSWKREEGTCRQYSAIRLWNHSGMVWSTARTNYCPTNDCPTNDNPNIMFSSVSGDTSDIQYTVVCSSWLELLSQNKPRKISTGLWIGLSQRTTKRKYIYFNACGG